MTDFPEDFNDEVLEDEIEEVTESEVSNHPIDILFELLPHTIRLNLKNWVANYDIHRVAYNIFAVDFNRYLYQQIAEMWFGKQKNSEFFNLETRYISAKDFWVMAKVIADESKIIPESMNLTLFMRIAKRIIREDGFSLATYIYKDDE
jgi:hypothetical protein